MIKQLSLAVLLVLAMGGLAQAQYPQACNGTITNALGTSGGDVTVDNTVGGVAILNPRNSRCGVVILNTSANTIRCAESTTTVTTTTGFTLVGGASLTLGPESSSQTYKCIRTGGSSGTVNTIEAVQKGQP